MDTPDGSWCSPDKVEGLLLEEAEEPGPVFVEIVSFAFTVGVP